MALNKPTFNEVLSHYPLSTDSFGEHGRIVTNKDYKHTCALRLSTALEAAIPGFFGAFTENQAEQIVRIRGHNRVVTFPYVRGAPALKRYLEGRHVGWHPRRLASRREAVHLATPGIIFWKVKSSSDSPNHIDLWSPAMRTLRAYGGRTMLWVPAAADVEYALFWELNRGGAFSPPVIRHSLQSG